MSNAAFKQTLPLLSQKKAVTVISIYHQQSTLYIFLTVLNLQMHISALLVNVL